MEKFKIYTNDELILKRVAEDFNVELDYLKQGVGKGYVLSGTALRVFIGGSHVDHDQDMKDISADYLPKEKFTL